MKLIRLLLGLKKPHEILFFEREYKSLAGVGNRLIISLIIILTLTFAAICFAVGAIENLKIKMNDPFTNWIDIPLKIRSEITYKNVSSFLKEFDTDSIKSEYAIENITPVGTFSIDFYKRTFDPMRHPQDTLVRKQLGQTINFESALFNKIVSKGNVLQDFTAGDSLNPKAQQIIVKKELLFTLGYEEPVLNGPYLFIQNSDQELIPLYVAGIVEKLPGNVSFVCSESFKNVYGNTRLSDNTGLPCGDKYIKSNKRGGNQFSILLPKNSPAPEIIRRNIATSLGTKDEIACQIKDSSITINSVTFQQAKLEFGYRDTITYKKLFDFATQNDTANKSFLLIANFDTTMNCDGLDNSEITYLQFNFIKLDYIKAFAREMQDKYGVNLSMREIESKENFSLVSNLTMAISLILFAFGLLSIILYVNNQLRSHLNGIKSNLGTFKAFGLSNRFLTVLYRKIVFSYLVVGVVAALMIVFLIDLTETSLVDANDSKFNALSPWLFLAIAGLFIISDLVSRKTTKRILGGTPGDLIYNR